MHQLLLSFIALLFFIGSHHITLAQSGQTANYVMANYNKNEVKIKMRDGVKLHTTTFKNNHLLQASVNP